MRTFGDDDETVGTYAAALTRGMQAEGVIACPKHFPGMGRTESDSHMFLPKVEGVDRETLLNTDLAAVKKCLDAGAQTIMTNHGT
jgi:beta-glucosidase-like glycosyl hydrolase